MPGKQATVTTDHQEIRSWAEGRGATPACVRGTGGKGDIGMLRLDFPGYSGADSLEHITWEEWFKKFDERGLALLHQDQTARGQKSNFNKLISRQTANARSEGGHSSRRRGGSSSRRTSARSTTRRASARRSTATTAKRRSSRTSRPSATARRSSSARSKSKSARASGARASSKRSNVKTASTRRRSTSAAGKSRRSSGRSSRSRVLTDHDEIRQWAEQRGAAPACVRGTGGGRDVGMIRLDFPGFSGARSLEHVDWDEWFKAFEDSKLALLVQDSTARGEKSNFNKLVGRETARARERGVSKASRRHPERASRKSPTKVSGRSSNKSTAKSTRGSTRAKRTESVRGRAVSRRKAA